MNAANWLVIFLYTAFLAFILFRIFKLIRPKLGFVGWFVLVASISLIMVFYCAFTYGYINSVARGPGTLNLKGSIYTAFLFFIASSMFTVPLAIFVFIITRIMKTNKIL